MRISSTSARVKVPGGSSALRRGGAGGGGGLVGHQQLLTSRQARSRSWRVLDPCFAQAEGTLERRGEDERKRRSSTAPVEVSLRAGESLLHVSEYMLDDKGHFITVSVLAETRGGGYSAGRTVRVSSNHPGHLIFHWGVVKSKSKSQSWYLPTKRSESVLPAGTRNYKKRALQSPFSKTVGHDDVEQQILIELKDGEKYENLNFVLKDTIENKWYNELHSESNFRIPLTTKAISHVQESLSSSSSSSSSSRKRLQSWEVPEIPENLCGIWAYIKWEFAGCPERSTQDADREFQEGIREMKFYLQEGYTLEELWKVANGEVKLRDFYSSVDLEAQAESTSSVSPPLPPPPPPMGPSVDIPEQLLGIQAYILWEQAGKPDGADFGEEARALIEEKVQRGWTLGQVEKDLKEPKSARESSAPPPPSTPSPPTPTPSPPPLAAKPESKAKGQAKKPRPNRKEPMFIPEALLGLQAYILWEHAGKPDGADFSAQAREEIERLVSEKNMSLEQIEGLLKKDPSPKDSRKKKKSSASPAKQEKVDQVRDQQAAEVAVPVPPESKSYNPLKWIKPEAKQVGGSSVPNLVREAVESEKSKESPLSELIEAATLDSSSEGNVTWMRVYPMGNSCNLLAVVRDENENDESGSYVLTLTTDLPNKVELHWGILKQGKRRSKWTLPESSLWPSKTKECEDGISVDTAFGQYRSPPKVPLQQVSIRVPSESDEIFGVSFVVKSLDATQWWKDGGHSNYVVPFPNQNRPTGDDNLQDALVDEIVDRENQDQWTLMHRFNACAELIRGVMDGNFYGGDRGKGFSTLYIWLRYSSMRQLTWQRNYNTQPRILSGAQENLTLQLTRSFREASDCGSAQQWARMCMSCVGKGGSNGQKIRDDILHIMHRHKIKEVKGTWMEEWHQKLHNNTTPDDVPICEAYIGFLENGGNGDVYWRVLSDAGITRERLESFDRPIVCEPEDFPDKREGLISDFRDYLRVLKSVHSGTDLQTAASACNSVINQNNDLKSKLGYVLSQAGMNSSDPESARAFIQCAVDARAILHDTGAFNSTQDDGRQARDCLYLDAALESQIRASAESVAGSLRTDSSGWVNAAKLVEPLMQNLCLSTGDNSELCYCLQAWQNLPTHHHGSISKEDALLVSSVVDRMKRAVGDLSDKMTAELQPVAHSIGTRTDCDRWTVELFTEEVVRGGPAFSVSLVLSMLEPSLRSLAELGCWQIISPAMEPTLTARNVYRSEQLYSCMNLSFSQPCVLVCDRVTGEEEIPENCVAVLTRDSPDMLSHIAVRARNEKVLLATCHDEIEFERIKSNEAEAVPTSVEEEQKLAKSQTDDAKWFSVTTTASGSVSYERCDPPVDATGGKMQSHVTGGRKLKISSPKWVGKYVVGMDAFADEVVGAKSKNLAGLRDKIPDWIRLPSSLTIPFGTFEHVLEEYGANKEVSKALKQLTSKKVVSKDPQRVLEEAKNLAMEVAIPDGMWDAVVDGMKSSGIEWDFDSTKEEQKEQIGKAIKSVWASKFNLRAYYSLNKARLDFMDVRMAVLIQKVVNAKYAFVIHTSNPSTGDPGEIYCEVVKGLGEVLVGNYPGRALSFTCNKEALGQHLSNPSSDSKGAMINVESFPSKSVGLYLPESLMFRSDSNGEDLEGYAGAGLYDSVPLHYPEPQRVDYSNDPIMTDQSFRKDLLTRIAHVGLELEQVLGSPQDIEGCVDEEGNVYVVQTRPQM